MTDVIRILLLADTHLGFDLPVQARVRRRRRGHDFLANYATALAPAFAGEVDIVVHGGDVFNRSRPPSSVAYQAFEPLTPEERKVLASVVEGRSREWGLLWGVSQPGLTRAKQGLPLTPETRNRIRAGLKAAAGGAA